MRLHLPVFVEVWIAHVHQLRTEHYELGNKDKYWVRKDGVKMLGDYVMVGADFKKHPRGSIVDTSLGKGIVVDTGYFYYKKQLDIATAW